MENLIDRHPFVYEDSTFVYSYPYNIKRKHDLVGVVKLCNNIPIYDVACNTRVVGFKGLGLLLYNDCVEVVFLAAGIMDRMTQPIYRLIRRNVIGVLKHEATICMNTQALIYKNIVLDKVLEDEANDMYISHMVRKIHKVWASVISDPNHEVCKRRLIREFNELSETFV